METNKKNKIKTFKDLEFRPHLVFEGLQGLAFFSNGYGISVVRFKTSSGGYGSYTNNENEWEIAVLKGNKDDNDICYDTNITSDVIGYLTKEGVTKVMKQIQNLEGGTNENNL